MPTAHNLGVQGTAQRAEKALQLQKIASAGKVFGEKCTVDGIHCVIKITIFHYKIKGCP